MGDLDYIFFRSKFSLFIRLFSCMVFASLHVLYVSDFRSQ